MKTFFECKRMAAIAMTLGLSVFHGFGQASPPPLPPVPPRPPSVRPPVRPELLARPPSVIGQSGAIAPARAPGTLPNYVSIPQTPSPATNAEALVFDTESKDYSSRPGEMNAPFTFFLTNVSKGEVIIDRVQPSCGCTTAKLPPMPWHIAGGTSTNLDINVNLAGKSGNITKSVTIVGNSGVKTLLLKVNIAAPTNDPGHMNDDDRARNLRLALQNRQAVLQGTCAACHVTPAIGKTGVALYKAACGICHDEKNRAAMVADLANLKHPTDAEQWRMWIADSKPGSLMPAFGQKHPGGFLSTDQIESLVKHLVTTYPNRVQSIGAGSTAGAPKSR